MKHFAAIQTEFLKIARKWDDLSYEEQKGYLSRHPKSKRKLTAKPGKSKNDIRKKLTEKKKSISPKAVPSKKTVSEKTTKLSQSETPKLDKKLERLFKFYNTNLKDINSKKETISEKAMNKLGQLFDKEFPGFMNKLHMDMDGVLVEIGRHTGLIGRFHEKPTRTKKLSQDEFITEMKNVFLTEGERLPKIEGESDPYTDLKKKLKLKEPFTVTEKEKYDEISNSLDDDDKKYARYLVPNDDKYNTNETREIADTTGNVPIIKSERDLRYNNPRQTYFEVPISSNQVVGNNWHSIAGQQYFATFDTIDKAKDFIKDVPELERKSKLRVEIQEKTKDAKDAYKKAIEDVDFGFQTFLPLIRASQSKSKSDLTHKFNLTTEQLQNVANVIENPLNYSSKEVEETINDFDNFIKDVKNNMNLFDEYKSKDASSVTDNADVIKKSLKKVKPTVDEIDKLMDEHGYEKTGKDLKLPKGFKLKDEPTMGSKWSNDSVTVASDDGTMEFNFILGKPGQHDRYMGEIYYTIPGQSGTYSIGRRGIDYGITERFTNNKPTDEIIKDWETEVREKQDKISRSISVPVGGGSWKITPENITSIKERLNSGKTQTFAPHGMGIGYILSAKPSRFSNRASKQTEEIFGISPLYVQSYDHD